MCITDVYCTVGGLLPSPTPVGEGPGERAGRWIGVRRVVLGKLPPSPPPLSRKRERGENRQGGE
ncbi:hypothetical protein D3C72_2570110 [compost metagenome]